MKHTIAAEFVSPLMADDFDSFDLTDTDPEVNVKVWFTGDNVWFEMRDPTTNQTYFADNTGHEITLRELFNNNYPVPFTI